MWDKAEWMAHPMRLELTQGTLLLTPPGVQDVTQGYFFKAEFNRFESKAFFPDWLPNQD